MDAVTEDVTSMPDQQLAQTVQAGTVELARRATVRDAERTTDDMALAYLQAQGRVNGGPFETPHGFVGAYPRGWRVAHDGALYEALLPGVTTAPPSDAWTEVPAGEDLIPFWEPGEYDRDALVRDVGKVWRALNDHTDGPRPSEFPGGWSVLD